MEMIRKRNQYNHILEDRAVAWLLLILMFKNLCKKHKRIQSKYSSMLEVASNFKPSKNKKEATFV
jgi:hypothetical protein